MDTPFEMTDPVLNELTWNLPGKSHAEQNALPVVDNVLVDAEVSPERVGQRVRCSTIT